MATAAARSTSTGGVAAGGSNPNPNADRRKLRSPLGKPVPLTDITNTGRPHPARSIHVADVLKENAKLLHLLSEKTKIIEITRVEMHKLRLALQASRQQNLHLAQANSQMLAELNLGKDRLKALQHELSRTTAVLKVKTSKLKEVTETMPSKLPAVEVHQIYNKATSTSADHLVETRSAVPFKTGRQEPLQDKTNKRMCVGKGTNKGKSELSEGMKNTDIVEHSYKPHSQSIGHHEDPRKPLQRRSARLNQGSSGITEVPCETLHEDAFVPLPPSGFSAPKLYEPRTGDDMGKSLQNEFPCNATVKEVKALELKNNDINEQLQEEVNLEEITCARVAGVEVHEIDDNANNANSGHLVENQSYLPVNIDHQEPPQKRSNQRKSICKGANKQKLELCEDQKESNIEKETDAKCHSNSSDPQHHAEKMESRSTKSSRLNPGSCEVTNRTCDTSHEDTIAPLAHSRLNAFIEQRENVKQNDCCPATKSPEEQATKMRSSLGKAIETGSKKCCLLQRGTTKC